MNTNPGPPPRRPASEMLDMAARLDADGLSEVARAVRMKVQDDDDLDEPLPMPQTCSMEEGCESCS